MLRNSINNTIRMYKGISEKPKMIGNTTQNYYHIEKTTLGMQKILGNSTKNTIRLYSAILDKHKMSGSRTHNHYPLYKFIIETCIVRELYQKGGVVYQNHNLIVLKINY